MNENSVRVRQIQNGNLWSFSLYVSVWQTPHWRQCPPNTRVHHVVHFKQWPATSILSRAPDLTTLSHHFRNLILQLFSGFTWQLLLGTLPDKLSTSSTQCGLTWIKPPHRSTNKTRAIQRNKEKGCVLTVSHLNPLTNLTHTYLCTWMELCMHSKCVCVCRWFTGKVTHTIFWCQNTKAEKPFVHNSRNNSKGNWLLVLYSFIWSSRPVWCRQTVGHCPSESASNGRISGH